MQYLIELNNIKKSFVGVQALKGVDFKIAPGEIHCLVGENGCGKSTLIKTISGVHKPEEGEVIIDGNKVPLSGHHHNYHKGIAVIYQDLSLFPNLTVAENIAYSEVISQKTPLVNKKEMYRIAKKAMSRIQIDLNLNELVLNLPVGKQQLVAICRALVSDLKLLILDEPTASLTKVEVDNLLSVVKDLQQKGISILFVSHKLDEILEVAQKVTVIRDGETVDTVAAEGLTSEKITYLMTGSVLDEVPFKYENKNPEKVLEISNLSKKNNFKDISFNLYKGEIIGITGLIGSGRTELATALFGKSPAEQGSIVLDGEKIALKTISDAVDRGIAFVPENRLTEGLIMRRSVSDNIITASINKMKKAGGALDFNKIKEVVDSWISQMGVKTASPDVIISTLSGGNQQKVVIGKWLATNPSVLILDGPTVGIDVAAKSAIHNKIRELANQGMSVILISDEISEVVNNCNRVLVMRKGRIVGEVSTDNPNHEDVHDKIESLI